MSSYFHKHYGDLYPGHIAYSEDIMEVQQETQDAFANSINDMNGGQGCILGSDENAFILTPESKRNGRYIDQINLADGTDGKYVSIRQSTYRQPILLSRTSLYSVILKFQNKSETDITVTCELQNEFGEIIQNKRSYLNVPAGTEGKEFEVVFDLDYYPTQLGLNPSDVSGNDPTLRLPNDLDSSTRGEGRLFSEYTPQSNTAGASELYLVIHGLNKSKMQINQTDSSGTWNDDDPTFGVLMNINSQYGQLLKVDNGSGFTQPTSVGDLYFKTVYANSPCYKCEQGEAIIGGERVGLADSHVVVAGANSYGNVLSYIWMDRQGHLHSTNSEVYIGTEPEEPTVDEAHLHIANVITYADDSKDPTVIQDDDNQNTRLRSHHERLRRIENKIDWTQDIAIPPRFKYTVTGEDWVDTEPEVNLYSDKYNGQKAQNLDALDKTGYNLATDSDGNTIIKLSSAESFSIPITLKSTKAGKVTTSNGTSVIKSAQTSTYINDLGASDITRAQTFAAIKNMNIDVTNGIMTLAHKTDDFIIASDDKQAKETVYYPWDDSSDNRPKSTKNVKPTIRSYTITAGKNGKNDWESEFPGMTMYLEKSMNLKKLSIPIFKFKNCHSIKFILYKRQKTNNKTNTVWLEKKIDTSPTFSLKKATVKNNYQYMEDGFLWDFGKKGKTLEKGQYVIVALATVKSGTGTVYVETYKPTNSRDFIITYHGAANASHFLLKTRYHEIWYNSAKAVGTEVEYEKTGSIESGTVTWTGAEPIKSIKPLVNLTGTGATIYVDTGAGWTKVNANKANSVTGSKDSFRWKVEFKGDGKKTPTIKYDKKKKYAIKFEITRQEPSIGNLSQATTIDKNLCLTSKPFRGNEILRDYIGDINFALTEKRFSNYEFARVWGTTEEDALSIDLSASDKTDKALKPKQNDNDPDEYLYYPVYSLHYVDLKLSDFDNTSVDYSNYDPLLELDEHNLRLKLDTDYSYNDNDINLIDINQFELTDDTLAAQQTADEQKVPGLAIDLSKITASTTNQVIAKAKLDSPVNLGQYDGIKLGFTLKGNVDGTLAGLGIYISSSQDAEAPSNLNNEPTDINSEEPFTPEDQLPDLNSSQQDVIQQYGNTIIKRYEPRNGTAGYVYYKSIWNSSENKWEWQLLHDVKSYRIFELCNRTDNGPLKITENNNGTKQYYEVDIDGDSVNMQNVKEVGLVVLNDEGKYTRTDVNVIKLNEFRSIQHDYYPVFSASQNDVFTSGSAINTHKCYANGKLSVIGPNNVLNNAYKTEPPTSQISVLHQSTNSAGETVAIFSATSKSTANFNHIGIQLAADCAIVKNMFELELRKVTKSGNTTTKEVIDKVKIPTLTQAYYPHSADNEIPLVKIFKKLKTTDRFDEIALVTTAKFKEYAKQLKTLEGQSTISKGVDGNETINLFIGDIVLYQARTIPIFHPTMRMKFYVDNATDGVSKENTGIRKIGVVIDYQ